MKAPRPVVAVLALSLAAMAACSGTGGDKAAPTTAHATQTTAPGAYSKVYALASNWYCSPDLKTDPCLDANLDSTDWRRDLSLTPDRFVPAADPAADCFYVHPTIDWSDTPSNLSPSDDAALPIVLADAGRLSTVCRVFAPRYPAASFGGTRNAVTCTKAYTAVDDAFGHWLAQKSGNRPSYWWATDREPTSSPESSRSASTRTPRCANVCSRQLLVGARSISVPPGGVVGGTFAHLPLCTDLDQFGCVIAYDSVEAGSTPARTVSCSAMSPRA